MYGYLADLMVFVHLMYVSYVLVGQLAIIVASAFRWEWGRNRWFRLTHLLAIAIVALEAVMGWQCPLTKWEYQLRELAGQKFDGSETFMGRIVHQVMFPTGPGVRSAAVTDQAESVRRAGVAGMGGAPCRGGHVRVRSGGLGSEIEGCVVNPKGTAVASERLV